MSWSWTSLGPRDVPERFCPEPLFWPSSGGRRGRDAVGLRQSVVDVEAGMNSEVDGTSEVEGQRQVIGIDKDRYSSQGPALLDKTVGQESSRPGLELADPDDPCAEVPALRGQDMDASAAVVVVAAACSGEMVAALPTQSVVVGSSHHRSWNPLFGFSWDHGWDSGQGEGVAVAAAACLAM